MFKFGFFDSSNDAENISSTQKQWKDAEKVLPKPQTLLNIEEKPNICTHVFGDLCIKSVSINDVLFFLKKTGDDDLNSILQAEADHSDLITAEYEGGLKIWECTIDLINYIKDQNIDFSNKRVLDLGCGTGIVGIYTLLKGALVDFQDYNKEVIENTTIPNVILNCDNEYFKIKNCNFYCGDWKSFLDCLNPSAESKYDYILTSETIYNTESYHKLYEIFSKKLMPSGTIYLAAKSYYFGVGGSTRQFEKHMENQDQLKSEVCWKCLEGVQREILRITEK